MKLIKEINSNEFQLTSTNNFIGKCVDSMGEFYINKNMKLIKLEILDIIKRYHL